MEITLFKRSVLVLNIQYSSRLFSIIGLILIVFVWVKGAAVVAKNILLSLKFDLTCSSPALAFKFKTNTCFKDIVLWGGGGATRGSTLGLGLVFQILFLGADQVNQTV